MRFINYGSTLSFHVPDEVRTTVEEIANSERRTVASVARDMLIEGMAAKGIIA